MKPAIELALAAATLAAVAVAMGWFLGSPSMGEYEPLRLQPRAEDASGLHARYFGASTVLISDDETSLLVDGFFSRPNWARVGLCKIAPNEKRIDHALGQGGI